MAEAKFTKGAPAIGHGLSTVDHGLVCGKRIVVLNVVILQGLAGIGEI